MATRQIRQVQWTLKPDGDFEFSMWWDDGSEIHGHNYEDVFNELTDQEKRQLQFYVSVKPPKNLQEHQQVH